MLAVYPRASPFSTIQPSHRGCRLPTETIKNHRFAKNVEKMERMFICTAFFSKRITNQEYQNRFQKTLKTPGLLKMWRGLKKARDQQLFVKALATEFSLPWELCEQLIYGGSGKGKKGENVGKVKFDPAEAVGLLCATIANQVDRAAICAT